MKSRKLHIIDYSLKVPEDSGNPDLMMKYRKIFRSLFKRPVYLYFSSL